jgi:tetratricopeptide (TPR) repeat protein
MKGVSQIKRAVKSDEEYINQCNQQGFYPLAYYPHNYHFLWATATLEGDSKTAIEAALKTSMRPPDSLMDMCGYKMLQHFSVIPLYAYVTFGKWNDILNYKSPQEVRPYPQGVWHYARGMAFMAKNNIEEAQKELSELEKLKANSEVDKLDIWGINSAGALLKIGYEVLAGEIAAKEKQYNLAIKHLRKAVELEDQLRYDEPPTWFYPVRQNLGAVLIEMGRYSEAQKVYEENLKEIPDNGWALFGLAQALLKQNRNEDALEVEKKFKDAWQYADIELTSSRIL